MLCFLGVIVVAFGDDVAVAVDVGFRVVVFVICSVSCSYWYSSFVFFA